MCVNNQFFECRVAEREDEPKANRWDNEQSEEEKVTSFSEGRSRTVKECSVRGKVSEPSTSVSEIRSRMIHLFYSFVF